MAGLGRRRDRGGGRALVIDPLEDRGATFARPRRAAPGTPIAARSSRPRLGGGGRAWSAISTATTPTRGARGASPRSDGPRARRLRRRGAENARDRRRPTHELGRPASRERQAEMGERRRGAVRHHGPTRGRRPGDPQVSWLVEAEWPPRTAPRRHDVPRLVVANRRRFGRPTSFSRRSTGPPDDFPHLQPPQPARRGDGSRAGGGRGDLLGARERLLPIHYDGYGIDPWYRPIDDAAGRFRQQQRAAPMRPAC